MKRRIVSLVLMVGLLVGLTTIPATGATEVEIEDSIDAGIAWLAGMQAATGSWGSYERVAHTGLALIKLEDRAFELGHDPFDSDYEYSANVVAGLDYLLTQTHIVAIGLQPAGDPDSNGNGLGVYISDSGHLTYATGIALMALAGTRAPGRTVTTGVLAGWTYGAVVQDAVDYLAWGQNDAGAGTARGAWGYTHNFGWSDNSNSGYAVLGLDFAESAFFGFAATVPAFVKSELNLWIDTIQNDVDGDTLDGGSGYDGPTYWVNILKTGNLIYQMAFVGDSPTTARVIDAVEYVERHWNDANLDPGFRPRHLQSMYCLMKGLERMGIDTLTVGGMDIDWFDEVSSIIVDSQNADGSWSADYWGSSLLSTAWALLTLERVAPPSDIEVPLDIKPMSCPNPLQVKGNGVLPVAILGTSDFDVTLIDVSTITLEGVSPLRSSIEDVATPYDGGFDDPPDRLDCGIAGEDGLADLTLKFDKQAVVAALGDVEDGDVLLLTLTGNLTEDAGGTAIIGQDVVWIRKKGK